MSRSDTETYHIELTISKNRDTSYNWYEPRGSASLSISVPEGFYTTKQFSAMVDNLIKQVDASYEEALLEEEAERLRKEMEEQAPADN